MNCNEMSWKEINVSSLWIKLMSTFHFISIRMREFLTFFYSHLEKLVAKIPFFKVQPQFLPLSIKFKLPSVSGAIFFYNILSITSRKANLHFAEYLNEKDSITLKAFSFMLSRYMLFDFLTIKINTLFLILREILFAFKYIFEWPTDIFFLRTFIIIN